MTQGYVLSRQWQVLGVDKTNRSCFTCSDIYKSSRQRRIDIRKLAVKMGFWAEAVDDQLLNFLNIAATQGLWVGQ